MEDVLELYQQSYDPDFPLLCMDEKPYQLLGEARASIPMQKGVDWQFTTQDARIKLKRLYPQFMMIK
ncbi:MAG: hypothetical protein ABFC84_03520 [Veillonellales bacterium]